MSKDDSLNVELLTTREAARILNCAEITLHMSRSSGTLFGNPAPFFIKRGKNGRVFYQPKTLKNFNAQFKERANTAS